MLAQNDELDPAVRRSAVIGDIWSDRLRLAESNGGHAGRVDPPGNQSGEYGLGPLLAQYLVGLGFAITIGMAVDLDTCAGVLREKPGGAVYGDGAFGSDIGAADLEGDVVDPH